MTGYDFVGYYSTKSGNGDCYYNAQGQRQNNSNWGDTGIGTLYSRWSAHKHDVKKIASNATIIIKSGEKQLTDQELLEVQFGTTLSISISYSKTNNQGCYYNYTGDSQLRQQNNQNYSFDMPDNGIEIHAYSEDPPPPSKCVAAGTLITLADGAQVPVEQLTGKEILLVWNIYTGEFDVAPILFVDSDEETTYEVINLYFSDGTSVKVISEHGFWDYNLNEWVFLRKDAAQYIGHWFNKYTTSNGELSNTKLQLTDVVITEEVTTAWSPVTFGHLCYYVNGMLSMPGATEGFINIFEVNRETLKVDEAKMAADIDKYGLFTYEDFAEYIPEEVFYAFNGQYLKVAMGKGLLTWDDIFALIERYQGFWQTPTEEQVTA